MLPASSNASRPVPNGRNNNATDRFLTVLVIVSMLYTLLLGWGLLARLVPFRFAYLLMALPCLAPTLWYVYGFFRIRQSARDFGLLLSSLGWACVLIALLIKHMALTSDMRAHDTGAFIENPGQSQTTLIFFAVGFIALLIGATISARAWMEAARRGEIE